MSKLILTVDGQQVAAEQGQQYLRLLPKRAYTSPAFVRIPT